MKFRCDGTDWIFHMNNEGQKVGHRQVVQKNSTHE